MTTINEIFRTFGPEYLERFSPAMPQVHRKVIDAIIACRTEASGVALYECDSCGQLHRLLLGILVTGARRLPAKHVLFHHRTHAHRLGLHEPILQETA